jgi:hypothetical protein
MMKLMYLLILWVIISALLSCEDNNNVLVSFFFPEREKVFTIVKKNVRVTLRLSKENPFEHELWVVNKSDQRVWLGNQDIKLTVNGSTIVVPGIRNYDSFIKRANREAKLLCNNSNNPYSCVDEITERGDRYLGRGFSFGAIGPGEERRGYIIFNFPNPVTRNNLTSEFRDKFDEGEIFLSGQLKLHFKFGAVIEQCIFPVKLRIYSDVDKMPAALKSFWKLGLNY